ncbi:oxygenase [Lithospermum erythrorhizon]|uniref:Oxygenase n=1 Tax=Lithospermum erythrorhizon TaxID=34254 RepID=A0AAV3RTA7_LITER
MGDQQVSPLAPYDPPLEETYKNLLKNELGGSSPMSVQEQIIVEARELPLIDLNKLRSGEKEREECKREIAKASEEWGFFQVLNHGIPRNLLVEMREEQEKLFRKPFIEKLNDKNLLDGSYWWGTSSANCLAHQFSWSEAFHLPLSHIYDSGCLTSISSTMEQYASKVSELAQQFAEILTENIGQDPSYIKQMCLPNTCYLRMNRYPSCPLPQEVTGLMPHTDSDFLTILHQDEIGGLQLFKDGKWVAVKPYDGALIINIGDLFQAWSNDVYKSVEHRVVVNKWSERFSMAYFLCPTHDTIIESFVKPSVYRRFSFREYRQQVQEDVKKFGCKIGLPKFLNII